MENASKALIMAGGILLAIITLSLFIYMTTATTRIGQAQDEKLLAEQILAFNKEYEAYNKRRLYGTDVITIVNKAINHNQKMKSNEIADPYYINIIIQPTQTYETTVMRVDTYSPNNNKEEVSPSEIGLDSNPILAGGVYNLGEWKNGDLFMNNGIIDFFQTNSAETDVQEHGRYNYYIYSALTNFKRAIFKCDGVIYNEETGRIESMTFVEV